MYQACPNSIRRKDLDPTTDAGIAKMKMYNKLFDLAKSVNIGYLED